MDLFPEISRLILNTGIDLYIFVLWLRFLLQAMGADFYNPLSQFAVQATRALVDPLDRLFRRRRQPGIISMRRMAARWSFGALLLIVLLKLLQVALLGVLDHQPLVPVDTVFIALLNFPGMLSSVSGLLPLFIKFYFYAIIAGAILSWVAPSSPAVQMLFQISEPLLAPCRRLLPATGGLDFSPIIALLGLQIAEMVLAWSVSELVILLQGWLL
jgi:YggT family protein